MTIWTYAIIDWDLLTDDRETASGILPAHFWLTAEEAQAALMEELRSRFDEDIDYCGDQPGSGFEPPTFRALDNGDRYCDDWNGCELQVYALTPAPGKPLTR